MNSLWEGIKRKFGDSELMLFSLTVLVLCWMVYWTMVNLPALIVAVLLAYLIDGLVDRLCRLGAHRTFAISATLTVSFLAIIFLLLVGIPRVTAQTANFLGKLPDFLQEFQAWLDSVATRMEIPIVGEVDSESLLEPARQILGNLGEFALSFTFTNVSNIFSLVVYSVLIPLLLFFFLRDKQIIFDWLGHYIPKSKMLTALNSSLNEQFGSYVKGKVIEGSIICALSLVGFLLLGVQYALALSVMIGLSVIIPFVGAVAVTIPVVIVGLGQFGFTSEFAWMFGFYALVQVIDGQLLVPLLFSEVVKMHPVAILVAILFFGAIWGVWGVFFAIPLASLIKSVLIVVEERIDNPQQFAPGS